MSETTQTYRFESGTLRFPGFRVSSSGILPVGMFFSSAAGGPRVCEGSGSRPTAWVYRSKSETAPRSLAGGGRTLSDGSPSTAAGHAVRGIFRSWKARRFDRGASGVSPGSLLPPHLRKIEAVEQRPRPQTEPEAGPGMRRHRSAEDPPDQDEEEIGGKDAHETGEECPGENGQERNARGESGERIDLEGHAPEHEERRHGKPGLLHRALDVTRKLLGDAGLGDQERAVAFRIMRRDGVRGAHGEDRTRDGCRPGEPAAPGREECRDGDEHVGHDEEEDPFRE